MTAYPRATANMNPPFTMKIATRIPSGSVTVHGLRSVPSECEAFMPGMVGTESPASQQLPHVQRGDSAQRLRKCLRRDRLDDIEKLRSLAEPFSIKHAAAALGCTYVEARDLLGELSARWYLVTSPRGHSWSEEARRLWREARTA